MELHSVNPINTINSINSRNLCRCPPKQAQQCILWSVQIRVGTINAHMDFDIQQTLERLDSLQKDADKKDADQASQLADQARQLAGQARQLAYQKRRLADQASQLADQASQLADQQTELAVMASSLRISEVSSCCCYPGILHCPLRTGYLNLLLGTWCMCRRELNLCVTH